MNRCLVFVGITASLFMWVGCGGRPVPGLSGGGGGGDGQGGGGADLGPDLVVLTDGEPIKPPADGHVVPDPDGPGATPKCPNGWCKVPAGTFLMGSPSFEPCREKGSGAETQHQVTLTHAFLMSATEVTQAQYQTLMGYNPSFHGSCGGSCPVEMVSWYEAAAYANALSKQQGLAPCYLCSGAQGSVTCDVAAAYQGGKFQSCPGYRLPTEAEWEHAYRADTTSASYAGPISWCHAEDPVAAKIGWHDLNSGLKTHPVSKLQPNSLGLYDMAGNVFEWTHDRFNYDLGAAAASDPVGPATGVNRALRGGSWFSFARELRAAYRNSKSPQDGYYHLGFRLVRTTAS